MTKLIVVFYNFVNAPKYVIKDEAEKILKNEDHAIEVQCV
jgi:hypothetical protein